MTEISESMTVVKCIRGDHPRRVSWDKRAARIHVGSKWTNGFIEMPR